MFTYSKPIKTKRPTRKKPTRVSHKKTRGLGDKVNQKFPLDKSIQMYRMWFLFLKLGLDCEDNKIPIVDHKEGKNIKVKVSKSYYKEWDLKLVRTLNFDQWWNIKREMFLESKPEIVKGSERDKDHLYIKVDKRQKTEDVVREVRELLKGREIVSKSKYIIKQQHKYLATHMKYNVFIWKNLGNTRTSIVWLLKENYKYYEQVDGARIPQDESSIRRVLRNSEKLILETAVGEF
jgi:hypothetical protein